MKKLFYHKVYNILLFLSNRFSNRHILKYKIWAGSAILAMTSSCQSPKNNAKENQSMVSADSAAILIDSIPNKKEPEPPAESPKLPIMCYDIQDDIEPDTTSKGPNHIYGLADQMPAFTGGTEALLGYLKSNLKYPTILKDSNIMGKVIIRFIVEKDGSITAPEVIHSKHELFNKEALRVIREMPKWQPALHKGKPVRAYYTIPVRF